MCWPGAHADMDVLDETLFTHFTVRETEAPEVKIGLAVMILAWYPGRLTSEPILSHSICTLSLTGHMSV